MSKPYLKGFKSFCHSLEGLPMEQWMVKMESYITKQIESAVKDARTKWENRILTDEEIRDACITLELGKVFRRQLRSKTKLFVQGEGR